jgi:guanylate kinase
VSRAAPLVLAAPSGTGKTTLARRLVDTSERFVFSISATTRPAREGETSGVDYHFVDRPAFETMIEDRALVEWATVHGRLYGTPRSELDEAAARSEHVVLDIDVQGARQIRNTVADAKLIFVLPPSIEIMMERLKGRGTEDDQEVACRLRSALDELQAVPEFDYVVINDDLDRCVKEIESIVAGQDGGKAASVPLENVEVFRAGVARVLEQEYTHVNG